MKPNIDAIIDGINGLVGANQLIVYSTFEDERTLSRKQMNEWMSAATISDLHLMVKEYGLLPIILNLNGVALEDFDNRGYSRYLDIFILQKTGGVKSKIYNLSQSLALQTVMQPSTKVMRKELIYQMMLKFTRLPYDQDLAVMQYTRELNQRV